MGGRGAAGVHGAGANPGAIAAAALTQRQGGQARAACARCSDTCPSAYVPPRTEAERILAEVWAEVLHHERVGIEDNFFELGGDSIVTLQVLARAAQRGLRLTPKLLFENPTVAEAAARLSASDAPEEAALEEATPPEAPEAPDAGLSPEEWRDLLEELER